MHSSHKVGEFPAFVLLYPGDLDLLLLATAHFFSPTELYYKDNCYILES